MENPEQKQAYCKSLKADIRRLEESVQEYYGNKTEASAVLSEKRGYLSSAKEKLETIRQQLYDLEGELDRLNSELSSQESRLNYANSEAEKESIKEEMERVRARISDRKERRSDLSWSQSETETKVAELTKAVDDWNERYELALKMHSDSRDSLEAKRSSWNSHDCDNVDTGW